jgi:adenosine deaminase
VDYEGFLRRVPKAELHCHLEGSVRPATFADLARKHGVALPTDDAGKLYDYDTIHDFLRIYILVGETLIDRDDFARAAYETLEDGAKLGNLKYREMFFNPTNHYPYGVSYTTVVDGLIEGIHAAEADFGVRCRLIAAINRQESVDLALQMVGQLAEHRREEVIGIGMDHAENLGAPEKFEEPFKLAAKLGFHRTAHASEDAPPKNVMTCLDTLGCERIDHGYHILEDDAVVARARDDGIFFTVCMHSTAMVYGWRDLPNHPIRGMVERGLRVVLNSDDPPMFHTDIGQEYVSVCSQIGYGPEKVREFVMNGVEAAWLDDDERRSMRQAFELEFDQLMRELDVPA